MKQGVWKFGNQTETKATDHQRDVNANANTDAETETLGGNKDIWVDTKTETTQTANKKHSNTDKLTYSD